MRFTPRLLRTGIVVALILSSVGAIAATTGARGAGPRPSIVVLLVDDLPALDDRLWAYLPDLKRIFVDHGVRFSDMHGESPLCCPGRAGWLTGQHTFNHGVVENDARLFDPSMSLATQLEGVGYRTSLAGKYFNKYDLIAPTVPPGWDRFHGMQGGYYDYTIWNDGDPTGEHHGRRPRDYSVDVVGAKALADIDAAPRGRPLFAWVSVFAPHGPTLPAPRYAEDPRCDAVAGWAPANYNEADVSDKPAYVREHPLLGAPSYSLVKTCKSMLAVDDLAAALEQELDATGRLDDTVFVLTSDNGMNAGAHRLNAKSTPYSTQVPFFVSWPAVLGNEPRTVRERLENIDFAPTMCALAGCQLGPYPNGQKRPDGRSFLPLLFGTSSSMHRDAVISDMPAGGGGHIPPWYAISTTAASPLANVGCKAAGTDGCRWHYVEYKTGERELYDVSNGPCYRWSPGKRGDPCELQNLHGDPAYAALEAKLSARLAQLEQERGGPADASRR